MAALGDLNNKTLQWNCKDKVEKLRLRMSQDLQQMSKITFKKFNMKKSRKKVKETIVPLMEDDGMEVMAARRKQKGLICSLHLSSHKRKKIV